MNEYATMDAMLQIVYGDAPISEEELDALLGRSLSPRAADTLLDVPGGLGLSPGMRVLDIGCRDAKYAVKLARRYGCTVLAVDPLDDHIRRAHEHLKENADVMERVQIAKGRIEAIPAESASCDFIWSRDMLSHVPDLPRGLAECHRVLMPGGHMLVYQTFATELLEAREARFLADALAIVPENQAPAFFEEVARNSGFRIINRDPVASEWREHWEETGAAVTSKQLLQAARMRRNRKALVAALGEDFYNAELANCLWGVYQMIGKLCPTIYVLEKPSID